MHYKISRLPKSKIELHISFSAEDLNGCIDKALERIRKDLELPGFRKGTVPKEIARQKVGEFKVYEEALRIKLAQALQEIFDKESIEIIGYPEITVTNLTPSSGAETKVKFSILPDIKLPQNWKEIVKEVGKERKEIIVDETEVNKALTWLQESRSNLIPVSRTAKKGDVIKVNLEAFSEGLPIPNSSLKDYSFVLGSASFMPGVEEEIEGLSIGEIKDFEITAPENYWVESLKGKRIKFHVEVKEINERVLPELNDEFARSIGRFENLAALINSIREGLYMEKQEKEKERIRILILEKLNENINVELPDLLINNELDRMIQELKTSIEDLGMDWNSYLQSLKKDENSLRESLKNQAEKRARFALLLRKLSKEFNIEVTEEELEEEIQKQLLKYNSPEEANKNIDIEEFSMYTRTIIRNEKTLKYLETLSSGGNNP
jgi:trigger factor